MVYYNTKTNTCFTYKDYLGKYDDTIKVHGDDFDVELFKKFMPDEEMQAMLQAAIPGRPVTNLWANHEEKWRELTPDDLSAASCHRYLTHRFFIVKDLDPVSDPRKLQQLIAGIFRYTHKIRNLSRQQTAFEEALDEELIDQVYMEDFDESAISVETFTVKALTIFSKNTNKIIGLGHT